MRSSLRALALLTVAVLAVTGTAPAQHAACVQSYMLVPVTGQTLVTTPRVPCTAAANQPLKLGDLTPAHSRDLAARCDRACQAGQMAVNDPGSQPMATCQTLAPTYENTMVLERVPSSQCQASALRQAPSIVAPVRTLGDNAPRQAPPVMRDPAPVRQPMPMPMHNIPRPVVQHGSGHVSH